MGEGGEVPGFSLAAHPRRDVSCGRPTAARFPTVRALRPEEGAEGAVTGRREHPGDWELGRWFPRENGIFSRLGFRCLLPSGFLEEAVKKSRCWLKISPMSSCYLFHLGGLTLILFKKKQILGVCMFLESLLFCI